MRKKSDFVIFSVRKQTRDSLRRKKKSAKRERKEKKRSQGGEQNDSNTRT